MCDVAVRATFDFRFAVVSGDSFARCDLLMARSWSLASYLRGCEPSCYDRLRKAEWAQRAFAEAKARLAYAHDKREP